MLREGRIVESGTHAELLAKGGAYAAMAAHEGDARRARRWAAHERGRAASRDPGSLGTLRLLARALRYVAPSARQFAWKLVLLLISMLPLLRPALAGQDRARPRRRGHSAIGEQARPHPALVMALLGGLAGQEPGRASCVAVVGFQLALIALVGAAGSGSSERDSADAYLSSGHDQATRTDNEANAGFSLASGLLGLYDLRFTIRLTQAVNHHYRARLFERIQALPLTTFDDQRIGDAVFRVLYDTPAITSAVYRILFTPAAAGAFALAVVATLRSSTATIRCSGRPGRGCS